MFLGLDSEREYMVSVVSINEKGRSSIVQLTAHTTKPQAAERHTDQVSGIFHFELRKLILSYLG